MNYIHHYLKKKKKWKGNALICSIADSDQRNTFSQNFYHSSDQAIFNRPNHVTNKVFCHCCRPAIHEYIYIPNVFIVSRVYENRNIPWEQSNSTVMSMMLHDTKQQTLLLRLCSRNLYLPPPEGVCARTINTWKWLYSSDVSSCTLYAFRRKQLL